MLYIVRTICTFFFPLKEISVLCFHDISTTDWHLSYTPKGFEKFIHLALEKGYTFVPASQVIEHINGTTKLSSKTICLTFDDGYDSMYTDLLPILEKYSVPATIFILGNFSESNGRLKTPCTGITDDHLQKLQQSPLIELGYHSYSHKMVDAISKEELERELTPLPVCSPIFAFPGGHQSHEAVSVLKTHGYTGAFSIHQGTITKKTKVMSIQRNIIEQPMNPRDILKRCSLAIEWYDRLVSILKR